MAKAGELDWTDLMNGKVGEPEHPMSKSFKHGTPNKGGEFVTEEDLKKETQSIVDGWKAPGVRTPSKEEGEALLKHMFPQLSWTEKEWEKANQDWNDSVNNNFQRLKKAKVQDEEDNLEDWGSRKSFNDTLNREEELERNMHVEE